MDADNTTRRTHLLRGPVQTPPMRRYITTGTANGTAHTGTLPKPPSSASQPPLTAEQLEAFINKYSHNQELLNEKLAPFIFHATWVFEVAQLQQFKLKIFTNTDVPPGVRVFHIEQTLKHFPMRQWVISPKSGRSLVHPGQNLVCISCEAHISHGCYVATPFTSCDHFFHEDCYALEMSYSMDKSKPCPQCFKPSCAPELYIQFAYSAQYVYNPDDFASE